MTYFIGISSWIIQDGNYEDFRTEDKAKFALEFYPSKVEVAQSNERSLHRLKTCQYQFVGQTVFFQEEVWVLDMGIMAYQERKVPEFVRQSEWVEGELYLGIDPFFYFESLHQLPGMPELQYDWLIEKIWLETTPWLSKTDERGRTTRFRDESLESYKEVAATDAWRDDEQHAHYVLECSRVT